MMVDRDGEWAWLFMKGVWKYGLKPFLIGAATGATHNAINQVVADITQNGHLNIKNLNTGIILSDAIQSGWNTVYDELSFWNGKKSGNKSFDNMKLFNSASKILTQSLISTDIKQKGAMKEFIKNFAVEFTNEVFALILDDYPLLKDDMVRKEVQNFIANALIGSFTSFISSAPNRKVIDKNVEKHVLPVKP